MVYEMIHGECPFRKRKERVSRDTVEKRVRDEVPKYSSKFNSESRMFCSSVRFYFCRLFSFLLNFLCYCCNALLIIVLMLCTCSLCVVTCFPSYVIVHFILLLQLLEKLHTNRLGSTGRGFEDVKAHPFFRTVNWNHLEKGILEPPFKPNVRKEKYKTMLWVIFSCFFPP